MIYIPYEATVIIPTRKIALPLGCPCAVLLVHPDQTQSQNIFVTVIGAAVVITRLRIPQINGQTSCKEQAVILVGY